MDNSENEVKINLGSGKVFVAVSEQRNNYYVVEEIILTKSYQC